MNRETEERLVDFVADQHCDFNPKFWMCSPHSTGASGLELATVAQFLAFTTFSHERPMPAWGGANIDLLFQIAQRLDPVVDHTLLKRFEETGFQPDRFQNRLNATSCNRL